MTIRSNPPGAMAWVDDYPVGTTPVSVNYTYYGTRKIRLVKEGYETFTVMQPLPTPWYEFPPLDFFSENLVPGEIHDRRDLCYQLRPQLVAPNAQLLGRAEQLRAQGRVPLGAVPAGFASPAAPNAFPNAFPTTAPPAETIPAPPGQPVQPRGTPGFLPGNPAGQQPTMDLPPREPIYSNQPQGVPGAWQAPPGPVTQ